MNTISKKEIALRLGFFFPNNDRIDYIKLEKRVIETGLLDKLNISLETFRARRKQRFDSIESEVIKKHFGL